MVPIQQRISVKTSTIEHIDHFQSNQLFFHGLNQPGTNQEKSRASLTASTATFNIDLILKN